MMAEKVLQVVGQIAGIGGLAIGLLVIIFRDVIRKNIFPSLTKKQGFQLLTLIVVLSWSVAIIGIAAWVYRSNHRDGNLPLKIHPVVNLSQPIKTQVQLFATDKVRIYGSPDSLREVWFGNEWEPYDRDREYIVLGVPGTPITPQFRGSGTGLIKMEISYTEDQDKPRDIH